jgi:hypothetical protein
MKEENKTRRRTKFVDNFTSKLFDWTGNNLPQRNFNSTDVDLIFRDNDGNIMLLEIKRKKGNLSPSQYVTFQILNKALQALERELDGKELEVKTVKGGTIKTPIRYQGFNLLQFENTFFDDGKIYINRKEVTEAKAIDFFSFKK